MRVNEYEYEYLGIHRVHMRVEMLVPMCVRAWVCRFFHIVNMGTGTTVSCIFPSIVNIHLHPKIIFLPDRVIEI